MCSDICVHSSIRMKIQFSFSSIWDRLLIFSYPEIRMNHLDFSFSPSIYTHKLGFFPNLLCKIVNFKVIQLELTLHRMAMSLPPNSSRMLSILNCFTKSINDKRLLYKCQLILGCPSFLLQKPCLPSRETLTANEGKLYPLMWKVDIYPIYFLTKNMKQTAPHSSYCRFLRGVWF